MDALTVLVLLVLVLALISLGLFVIAIPRLFRKYKNSLKNIKREDLTPRIGFDVFFILLAVFCVEIERGDESFPRFEQLDSINGVVSKFYYAKGAISFGVKSNGKEYNFSCLQYQRENYCLTYSIPNPNRKKFFNGGRTVWKIAIGMPVKIYGFHTSSKDGKLKPRRFLRAPNVVMQVENQGKIIYSYQEASKYIKRSWLIDSRETEYKIWSVMWFPLSVDILLVYIFYFYSKRRQRLCREAGDTMAIASLSAHTASAQDSTNTSDPVQ